MALFDRFRSKKSKSIMPEEVEEYYQSEQPERRGVAILLGVITLVSTLLVAALIFFGGRAIYKNVTGSNQPTNTQSSKQNTDANKLPSDQAPQNTAPSPSPAPVQQNTPPKTPSLGDGSPAPLPRTGDEGL